MAVGQAIDMMEDRFGILPPIGLRIQILTLLPVTSRAKVAETTLVDDLAWGKSIPELLALESWFELSD